MLRLSVCLSFLTEVRAFNTQRVGRVSSPSVLTYYYQAIDDFSSSLDVFVLCDHH